MSTPTPHLKLTKPDRLEQYNIELLNSNFDKIDAAYNRLPRGIQASAVNMARSAEVIAARTGMAVPLPSVTFLKGRQYNIKANGRFFITTSLETIMTVFLLRDTDLSAIATKITGTTTSITSDRNGSFSATKLGAGTTFHHEGMYTPIQDEVVQVKLAVERAAGNGSIFVESYELTATDTGVI